MTVLITFLAKPPYLPEAKSGQSMQECTYLGLACEMLHAPDQKENMFGYLGLEQKRNQTTENAKCRVGTT